MLWCVLIYTEQDRQWFTCLLCVSRAKYKSKTGCETCYYDMLCQSRASEMWALGMTTTQRQFTGTDSQ